MNLGRRNKTLTVRIFTTTERIAKVSSETVAECMEKLFPSEFKALEQSEEYKENSNANWWVQRNMKAELAKNLMENNDVEELIFNELNGKGYINVSRTIISEETSRLELVK